LVPGAVNIEPRAGGGSQSGREHRAVYASAMSPMRRRYPSIDDDPIDASGRRIALAL